MSRLKPQKEYEKTGAFHFFRWLSGSKDPYLGEVEMQPQKEMEIPEATIIERMNEKQMIRDKVYDVEHNKELLFFHRIYVASAILFCVALVGVLLFTVSYLPRTGNPANPDNNEVSARYIESGLQETGALNIVSGMILTYRAFDTFGETNVLFIATCCVMVLLMVDDAILKKQEVKNDRRYEPKNDAILQGTAFVLCPIIFIFGIYVILNGHLSPGGGFSGGAILGAGLILYVSAFGFKKTQKFFNEHVYKIAKITALCMYGIIGSYFYILGANGIENHIPLGTPGHILSGGIILPIDICVGLEVACTMYAFYALFRRGGL
ncbi:MAG: MnhB domain-containing protein [Firmicutes bacterium]|nr:MnhB domain-containing protein [Bacillota bacterium]